MRVRGELHYLLNGSQRIVTLDSPKFTVGRGDESSLCLQDIVVSRNHAEIVRLGNDFLLRDHGSTNGSYINDIRVSERILVDGDVVRFGKGGPELTFHWYEESLPATLSRDTRQGTTENLVDSLVGKLTGEKVDPAEEATLRCVLAETYLRKGDHTHALNVLGKYTDEGLLSTLPGSVRATVLLWIGNARLEAKQYVAATTDLQRAFDLATQVGDPQGVAMAQIGLGEAKIGTGDLLAARDHLQRAMLVARRSDNVRIRASVHLLLGKIDWKEIDIDGARYNWQRAARFAEGCSDDRLDASVRLQQAFMLYAEGRLGEAVTAYQEAIKLIEEVGNVRLLLKAYSQLSRTLVRLGSWGEAEQLVERRLRTARAEHRQAGGRLAHGPRRDSTGAGKRRGSVGVDSFGSCEPWPHGVRANSKGLWPHPGPARRTAAGVRRAREGARRSARARLGRGAGAHRARSRAAFRRARAVRRCANPTRGSGVDHAARSGARAHGTGLFRARAIDDGHRCARRRESVLHTEPLDL
ncbi:MAG: tetratricopeptide repeat protein [Blastocatellia bacterium]|nr:tetratricopeptide repeat protein [Blastocatellia bacterium]